MRRADFYHRVLADVRALPGVESAAYTNGLPMVLTGGIAGVVMPGEAVRPRQRDDDPEREHPLRDPAVLRGAADPAARGRDVEETDTADAPLVAVVSESFVQALLARRGPIGLDVPDPQAEPHGRRRGGRHQGARTRASHEPQVYLPATQFPEGSGWALRPKDLVIRVAPSGDPVVHSRIVRQSATEQTALQRADDGGRRWR